MCVCVYVCVCACVCVCYGAEMNNGRCRMLVIAPLRSCYLRTDKQISITSLMSMGYAMNMS